MPAREKLIRPEAASVLVAADHQGKSIPVWLVRDAQGLAEIPLSDAQKAWVEAQGFKGAARKHVLLPGENGRIAGALLGLGPATARDPMDRPEIDAGLLPTILPPGLYHLEGSIGDGELAAVACGLGAYRFRRYKAGNGEGGGLQLKVPAGGRPSARDGGAGRRLAGTRSDQHAGERHGPPGAGGCRARTRGPTRRRGVEHRGRRPRHQEFSHDPCRRPGQHARRRA